jgi:hypothetical protein
MSGLGADGVLGLLAIKQAGGISLVQDPAEAKFGTMPLTAISEDDVDGVVSIPDLVVILPELVRGNRSSARPRTPTFSAVRRQTAAHSASPADRRSTGSPTRPSPGQRLASGALMRHTTGGPVST